MKITPAYAAIKIKRIKLCAQRKVLFYEPIQRNNIFFCIPRYIAIPRGECLTEFDIRNTQHEEC